MDDDAKARLAKVQDPDMRRLLTELYYVAMRNEKDPKFWAREREREAKKREDQRAWAHALTSSALRGVFGKMAQDLANKYTLQGSRMDDDSCRAVASEVCKLEPEDRRRVRE